MNYLIKNSPFKSQTNEKFFNLCNTGKVDKKIKAVPLAAELEFGKK